MKRALSLVLALVLLLGLIPRFPLQAFAASVSLENLRYDDHVDITGKQVEIIDAGHSGQGAVITLEGNYLVAAGVGTAKVRIDGTVHTVTVSKAKINLIMIMGQSNAGNHFENATSDVTCPLGTAYWWGNGQGTAATQPVSYTQPSMGFHTPLLAELYAQSVAAGDPVKNVMIWEEGITSKNGQPISAWVSSPTDTSGTDGAVTMLQKCRAYYLARSDRYEIVGSGIYWLQGESDEASDPTLYTQRFMAMWQRLKNAGMEYVAFLRVRRNVFNSPADRDDLYHSASLSAQIKMINETPEFYMATTLTENWIGTPTVTHTVDISNYITMMQTYGKSASYTDPYGNTATYADGKLTTTMKSLFGSNNICHYGKFGYGAIGADAAYNMYRALHGKAAAMVVTDTSGYASRAQVLTNGQRMSLDITGLTDNLSFRADCGSTSGTLKFIVRSGVTDITGRAGLIVSSGDKYGSVSISALRSYPDVSVVLIYTTAEGAVHTAVCELQTGAAQPKEDYVWDFDQDLKARSADGEVLNSFLSQALYGSYTIQNGYLNATGLQLKLENTVELSATRDWSIEWKYGSLAGGTAGFLLCEDNGNTVGNKALWHITQGNFAIADYLDSAGYRNYTSDDVILRDYDCLKLTNSYDPITGKSTLSLWINGERKIADFQQKGSINGYHDNLDMTGYPLVGDFAFGYLGNSGMSDWRVNCQLDYLKISFGEVVSQECDHSYRSQFSKAATCEADGIRTHTCDKCGDSYTETLPATGHRYSSQVTAPTCTAQGYTTFTCSSCGDSYTGSITAASGHRYSGPSCTVCGAENPDYEESYYLVGFINGADYGCESDWQNMGQYRFVNGKLAATFTQDSYVFLKTEGNADWYMTAAYCTDTTAIFSSTRTGTTEKMFIPGNVEITFTLTENADGSLTLSYTTAAAAVVKPTLKLKSPTLEFKDMITVNAFFTAENLQDVVEMGMITYSTNVASWSVETAQHVIPGVTYDASTGRYIARSQGIHAKYLGDSVYMAVYARLRDGTYTYSSRLAPYSPVQYATSQLNKSTDVKLKQLCAALLNYGAEAQLYFGHNTGNLANATLTAAQKALPEAYRSDMTGSVPAVSAAKQSIFANNNGFAKRAPAISFEGALCIHYFFTPNYAPDTGITLCYWNAEDFNAAPVLTTANATGFFKMEGSGAGQYRGVITGIAAKDLSDAIYVAAAYKSNGKVWTSGVLGYSIGAYCASQASKGTAISDLAMATAVYGYHAKQYFG